MSTDEPPELIFILCSGGLRLRVNRLINTVEHDKSCGTVTLRGRYVFEGSKLMYGVMLDLEKYWFVGK